MSVKARIKKLESISVPEGKTLRETAIWWMNKVSPALLEACVTNTSDEDEIQERFELALAVMGAFRVLAEDKKYGDPI